MAAGLLWIRPSLINPLMAWEKPCRINRTHWWFCPQQHKIETLIFPVCVCVSVWVYIYPESQWSSDQCVCRLNPVRFSIFGAVTIWKSFQIQTRKELEGHGGIHESAPCRDGYQLRACTCTHTDTHSDFWLQIQMFLSIESFLTWRSLRKRAGLMVLRRTL